MSRRGEPNPGNGLSLNQLIAQIDTRLDALRPMVEEFQQLESARAVLTADNGGGVARPRAARSAAAQPRRSRRAPRGANREAILRVAGERPGITVAEIAAETGIGKPTVHSTVYALKRRGTLQNAGDGVRLAATSGKPARLVRSASPARIAAGRRSSRAARRRRAERARRASSPASARAAAVASTLEALPRASTAGGDAASAE